MQGFLDVVAKYGTPEEINARPKKPGNWKICQKG